MGKPGTPGTTEGAVVWTSSLPTERSDLHLRGVWGLVARLRACVRAHV